MQHGMIRTSDQTTSRGTLLPIASGLYILGGVRRRAHWLVRGRPGNGSSRSHSGRLLPTCFPCHHTHPGHDCDASWKRLTRLRARLLAFLVRVVNVNLISCGRCSVATLFPAWHLLPYFNTCGTRCRGLSQATHQAVRQAGY
ncbi:hypothetical protein COCMIDRAFT_36316 [Bipolaris oryzae ATCC 44560]|uniref:Uncharacterized protein n=1 Tax=Bipolaris oryzae ATCC 44560 TaxID=930090 RepID=W6ZQN1_COCMI|nr:uncharacterized protein COCMIDRAFT_36316 [Bipolaris oryzae ATCC 44560]EUC46011.1 hypothetical protein COCMIDRAFT_36316 [Bipolaris oryzae ATCC 44560]